MKSITDYVNVFQGNSVVKINNTTDISSAWHFIKGLSGNTHPGAQLPFGKISACAYSGGYPTGYGNNRLNCGEPVEKLYDNKKIIGVSHFHHSGTGAVGHYYNYAVVSPFNDTFSQPRVNTLVEEFARPGYYKAKFLEENIEFELTTDENSAYHRYIFSSESGNISVDLSNDGLYDDMRLRGVAGKANIEIVDSSTARAVVNLQGIDLYFTIYCDSGDLSIWKNYVSVSSNELTTDGSIGRFGVLYENTDKVANVIISVSVKSHENTCFSNIKARENGFEEVVSNADKIWNEMLSRIEITADEKNKEIFYSNLYHSLVKPSDWSGENIYTDCESFVLDFTTLWDIYKTQLPLLFTLYPEISDKIVKSYLSVGKALGVMPNLFNLSAKFNGEAQQARFLEGYLFSDAYYRGIDCVDWNFVLNTLVDILLKTEKGFFDNGECSRTTHTLDMSEACRNLSEIAKELGRDDIVNLLEPYIDNWINAFDKNSGLLNENSEYYEGNFWNYSFRPINDMNKRIELAGGKENFIKLLDKFFGFVDREETDARFEGFNNETDMEAPYAYNYVGRLDRLAEVIDSANKDMFTDGEGGAPGNIDSGGLSACYLWNVMGIFPVSGQNLMLVGKPYFEKTKMHLRNGKDFSVVTHGKGSYVKLAELNGEPLHNFRFSVTQMMQGGVLNLYTE